MTVTLTTNANSAGARLTDDTGIATIIDDDTPTAPTAFSIGDVSLSEGESGQTAATFTVAKSGPGAASVTASTADSTATAPGDYTAITGQVLPFGADDTSARVTVQLRGDADVENDETFFVRLSSPTNGATISDGQGLGLIANDDRPVQPLPPLPTVSIGDVSIAEGDAGARGLVLTVSLSRPASEPVTVRLATADASATAPGDYSAVSNTVELAAGGQSETVTVPVLGDAVDEDDESFAVRLSQPTGATLGDAESVATIVDDDRTLISVSDVALAEGDAGAATAALAVSLSTPSAKPVGVTAATADASARAGGDYVGSAATVAFAPGETAKSLPVQVVGDTATEPDERFFVNLSASVNAGILKAQGVVTIIDDEGRKSASAIRVVPRITASTTPPGATARCPTASARPGG